jgi:ribosome maturation factor RimP
MGYFCFMSTRQLRLSSPDQIQKRAKEFTGKKINIVLHDRTVVLATLQEVDHSNLKALNMRLKKISIPMKDISEIYYDTKE